MKKTLTANISGTVFHVEEDAYEKLLRYLDSIRLQFTGNTQEEIMGDIEARIAELLQERMDGRRQVVAMADVEHVIGVMGQPEDYMVADEEAAGQAPPPGSGGPNWTWAQPRRKRLFRDPDDRWVGGVLGGIGAYFNIDPLILRIIYIVLLFLGIGWLIYLILWVVVPVATTATEKLEMRGEAVNVENIKRVFEEGAERVRTGAETISKEAQEVGRKYGPQARRGADEFLNFLGDLFRLLFKVIGKVIGVVLLLGGAFLAILLTALIVGRFSVVEISGGANGSLAIHDLSLLLFDQGWAEVAWIGMIGFVLVPLIGLIQGGISLLFAVPTPKWFGHTLTAIWIASIIALSVVAVRVASDMQKREVLETKHTLNMPAQGTITLLGTDPDRGFRIADRKNLGLLRIEGDDVDLGLVELDVKQSKDSLYHLVVLRSARGASYDLAGRRAEAIGAPWQQTGDSIILSPWIELDRDHLFRGQHVRYILHVPVGGAVHFDRSVKDLLDDVQNTTDTYDGNMIGKTWNMIPGGLHREGEIDRRSRRKREREADRDRRIDMNISHGTEAAVRSPLVMPDLAGVLLRRI